MFLLYVFRDCWTFVIFHKERPMYETEYYLVVVLRIFFFNFQKILINTSTSIGSNIKNFLLN